MDAVMQPQPMTSRQWTLMLLAWLTALVATLGALVFSEVMNMVPCVLCWYQRIAMFPLVLLLAQGLYAQDRRCADYALPLAAVGWLVALYHCLLYAGVIPKNLQPCGKGASCAEQSLTLAGFVTIPLLSLLAFSALLALLLLVKKEDAR
jgi:disulfide bond formation protein DsbB